MSGIQQVQTNGDLLLNGASHAPVMADQNLIQPDGEHLRSAASKGDLIWVTGLVESNPELAESTDSRRRSALHLASSKGHTQVVEFLVEKCDIDMCTARDADGRNPLHLAAMKGEKEIVKLLVKKCPHAAEARADRGETILHLWLKYNHKESLKSLLLEVPKLQKLVNAKNDDGDTVLHLVVADDDITDSNLEMVKCLLACDKIDVSVANAQGETALDILQEIDAKARRIRNTREDGETTTQSQIDLLRRQGAKRGEELGKLEWLAKKRDSLMVVASLIAIMAFQAGVTPPGGVWQDNNNGHRAGETVMAYNYPDTYPYFLRLNSVGFVGSLSTILLLISELPFRKKIFMWVLVVIMWGTITTMAFTYSFAITVITPIKARPSLSSTIAVGVIVWGSVMVVLLVIHTVKLILILKKEKRLKYLIIRCKKKLGLEREVDASSVNGSIA